MFVATVTGIVLLIWYRPSAAQAWQSVEATTLAPFSAGFLRSLQRYSSDVALMFGTIHALRSFLEGRLGGARWLAWVTGGILMGLLWAIGWSGYWLVWDMRAQLVAVGTAKLMDVLPIFGDRVSRSFLTDEGVNSLHFLVVFFMDPEREGSDEGLTGVLGIAPAWTGRSSGRASRTRRISSAANSVRLRYCALGVRFFDR